MITPSAMPSYRMSQGIVCASPSLTITPYVTDSWSFALPRENVTRTPIYDEETGEIIYYSEIPRFEKDTFNLNYGISAQVNIPFCLLYTSPSPRDRTRSRMPSSA